MKKLILILLLWPLFVSPCYAEGLYERAAEETGAYAVEEALPETERELSGPLRLDGSYDAQGALRRLWERLLEELKSAVNESVRSVGSLIAIGVLGALAAALIGKGGEGGFVDMASCSAAALLLSGGLESLIGRATAALAQLSDYSKAALPAVFSAAAAGGAVVSASARYAAACLAMDVIISAQQRLVLPLIYAYLAVAVSRSLFDNGLLQGLIQLIKWAVTTALTGITLAFSAYVSLTGIVTGSSDVVAVKATRTVIASVLPVVGGILSDSASVLLAAASVIKNAVGAFSLVAVCALCAGPFALLFVKMLLFKFTAAVTDMLPSRRFSRLIGEIGTCCSMLLGMVGSCGVMLFISIMSGVKAVAG